MVTDTPWDFYLFVGISLLGYKLDEFLKITPNLFMKEYILWLKMNNPDAIQEVETVYVDQVPFL
ncbi:MAG: hypothetical protein ABF539_09275 [Liquorilactobacillus nagelii]|uniref:hypothetical protein n=1 Tax=Liquorilactobacillus nagelii TaxID=82688 RepID=UPI0039EB3A4A